MQLQVQYCTVLCVPERLCATQKLKFAAWSEAHNIACQMASRRKAKPVRYEEGVFNGANYALVPFPGTADYFAWEAQINELAKRKAWRRLEVISRHLQPQQALSSGNACPQSSGASSSPSSALSEIQSSFRGFRELARRPSNQIQTRREACALARQPRIPLQARVRSSEGKAAPRMANDRAMFFLMASMQLENEAGDALVLSGERRRLRVLCAHLYPWQTPSLGRVGLVSSQEPSFLSRV